MDFYMKKWIFFIGCCWSISGFAQSSWKPIFNLAYINSGGNYLQVGPGVSKVLANNHRVEMSINANMGYMKERFIAIPEAGFVYVFNTYDHGTSMFLNSNDSLFLFKLRTSVSPWSVTPDGIVSLFGIIDFSLGYTYEFNTYKDFKSLDGIRLGLGFAIPIP